jgi:hypothetical protein
MRRTTAATATFFAALAIGGPFTGTAAAGPATLHCAVASPPAACEHLDDLAGQLAPISGVLGPDLAELVTPAQGFAARSDQAAGVPIAEVVRVSTALNDRLGDLPRSVESLLGAALLGDLTGTLDALVADLTAPVSGSPSGAGTSEPTPAKTAPSTSSSSSARSSDTSSFGASGATGGGTGQAASGDAIPDVPVGDPLLLAPLAMPDFGFDQSFAPAVEASIDAAAVESEMADAVEAMSGGARGAELAVVVVLSLLLIAGAGVAHLQAQRHTIPS